MAFIEANDRNQITMFPKTIDEYISEENPVRLIDAYINGLDLEKLGFKGTNPHAVGHPGYDPKEKLKLYLYGYMNRIRSSRRLEHEAIRNIEVIWLMKNLKPDFKTIADFRKDNKKALKAVFRDFNKLCYEWNMFGKELVAIDGTKIRANNSKKNNFNEKKLNRQIKYIDEKIEKYMKDLDETDKSEEVDNKLSSEELQDKIKQLKDRRTIYEEFKDELKDKGINEISKTDKDCKLMANGLNQEASYNVQSTVDSENK